VKETNKGGLPPAKIRSPNASRAPARPAEAFGRFVGEGENQFRFTYQWALCALTSSKALCLLILARFAPTGNDLTSETMPSFAPVRTEPRWLCYAGG
jgi:hypothetical protein